LDYACLLSALRVFVSLFEQDGDDKKLGPQNNLLGIIASSFRFPPAIRAMHDLISQKIPSPEDRAALSQCILEYYQTLRDPFRPFELQFPYLTFGHLYGQVRSAPDCTSFRNLDAISTQGFVCPITQKRVDRAICFESAEETTLIDPDLAPLYCDGPLRKTVFVSAPREGRSIAARLSVYFGGRFDEVTYVTSPIFDSRAGNVDQTNTTVDGRDPFALIAPKDLPTVDPLALTRDASGGICVYLGKGKAVEAKYIYSSWMSLIISTRLFSPLKGEELVDVSLVTAALARIQESHKTDFPFVVHGKISEGREPDEIIMICLDRSWSMDEAAGFPDTRSVGGSQEDIHRVPRKLTYLTLSYVL
jgi:hypothetical protein